MSSANPWAGRRALVTGGLGFIGSNLAIRLAGLGARVTLVDAMIPEYGGNLFNIEPVRDRVTVNFGDVCDRLAMNWLVKDQDYVFHLAGQVSHVMSMTDPFPDIEFNIKGTAVVMEAVRSFWDKGNVRPESSAVNSRRTGRPPSDASRGPQVRRGRCHRGGR